MMNPTAMNTVKQAALSAALSLGLLAGAATIASANDILPKQWQAEELREHSLVGTMWETSADLPPEAVDVDAMMTALGGAMAVGLGEVHDNPDHHILQANIIRSLKADDITVVFEMVPQRLQPALDAASEDMASLGLALEWEKRGWYGWPLYRPIFEAAMARGASLVAGSPDRRWTRVVSKQGFAELPLGTREKLDTDTPIPTGTRTDLMEQLATSHCGMMPASALPAMARVQRFRDATMASAMGRSRDLEILIAGNEHIRKDRGVPLLTTKEVTTVMLVEVQDGRDEISDYSFRSRDGDITTDFIIFTPRAKRGDPCEAMRDAMKKKTK